jgi:hypothetical protein
MVSCKRRETECIKKAMRDKVREKVLTSACEIIAALQLLYSLGSKWGVRKQCREEFNQLIDLKVHKSSLLKEVSDTGHIRFKQLGEV